MRFMQFMVVTLCMATILVCGLYPSQPRNAEATTAGEVVSVMTGLTSQTQLYEAFGNPPKYRLNVDVTWNANCAGKMITAWYWHPIYEGWTALEVNESELTYIEATGAGSGLFTILIEGQVAQDLHDWDLTGLSVKAQVHSVSGSTWTHVIDSFTEDVGQDPFFPW